MAAAAFALRVPNERDDATADVDSIDGPIEGGPLVPVAALCTVRGL